MTNIYDFIGIGLGPFNLSLACLTQPIDDLNGLFLEQRDRFDWHPGMMLEGVSLQTPFMSDLVTLADPTHSLSFLNYAKQKGRLYQFYIKESFFLLREEYNQYCQWACEQLDSVRFQHRVTDIRYLAEQDCYQLQVKQANQAEPTAYYARKLVLGTGPTPYLTPAVKKLTDDIIHSSQYMEQQQTLYQADTITIVGSGQSAAEIYLDLLQHIDHHSYQLNWITRAPRFFPLEYSKLTLEMTSPEYVDYFYHLPQHKRDSLIASQKHLYKGINSSLINEIYDLLYQKSLNGQPDTQLLTNCELVQQQGQKLTFRQTEKQQLFTMKSQKLVMATGYAAQLPDCLSGVSEQINWDDQGRYATDRYYSIDKKQNIFVQNAELHTHGFVTPDLGMACYRNSQIIRQLCGREIYPTENRIAFQQFSAPSEWLVKESEPS